MRELNKPLELISTKSIDGSGSDSYSFIVPDYESWKIKAIEIESSGSCDIVSLNISGLTVLITSTDLTNDRLDMSSVHGGLIDFESGEELVVNVNNRGLLSSDASIKIRGIVNRER